MKSKMGRPRRIDRETVACLVDAGKSDNSIAKELKCSAWSIQSIRRFELKKPANFKRGWQSNNIYPAGKVLYSERILRKMSDEEIAKKYSMPLHTVGEKIGFHLMSLCRQDAECPFKALLPETMV